MAPPATLSTRLVARVVAFVASRGHDADAFCHRAKLSPALVNDPAGRIPYAQAELAWNLAAEVTRDPNFGLHLAQQIHDPAIYDAGALLLMSSATLRSGFHRLERYQRYWSDGERFRMSSAEGGARFRFVLPREVQQLRRHGDECALAEMALGARMLTATSVNPRIVRFQHAPPADTTEHDVFFQCPIEFDAPHTEIEFDDAVLDLPLAHANEAFGAIFEHQVRAALDRLPGTSGTAELVRTAARAALAGGECTLDKTARTMRISARTLQRRLQDEGTTFDAVVDALRRELAMDYLARAFAIGEIALLLGYSDATAFHHAFKRWTGITPEEARRRAG